MEIDTPTAIPASLKLIANAQPCHYDALSPSRKEHLLIGYIWAAEAAEKYDPTFPQEGAEEFDQYINCQGCPHYCVCRLEGPVVATRVFARSLELYRLINATDAHGFSKLMMEGGVWDANEAAEKWRDLPKNMQMAAEMLASHLLYLAEVIMRLPIGAILPADVWRGIWDEDYNMAMEDDEDLTFRSRMENMRLVLQQFEEALPNYR